MSEVSFGLLLAGGRASRMGGGDKPLLKLAGRTILAWVIERLAPQCAGLVLNANGDAQRFSPYLLPVVADTIPGFAGPLAGILSGLDWLAEQRSTARWAVSVAADTPFIPHDLVAVLHARRHEAGADIAVAASAGRTHPVIALWPVEVRHALRQALVSDEIRKIDRFTARFRRAIADWPVESFDPFFNVNEPQDLALAEPIAARLVGAGKT
jgi:molybdopterin-guanine dinucleotide biosynthesis protein A